MKRDEARIADMKDKMAQMKREANDVRLLQKDEDDNEGVIPALAEKNSYDGTYNWYCCKCGAKQCQKEFDVMKRSCSKCGESKSFGRLAEEKATYLKVQEGKRARTSEGSTQDPAAELGEESGPRFMHIVKNDIPALAEYQQPSPSTNSAACGSSPEPMNSDSENIPGQAAYNRRRLQEALPVDTMPSVIDQFMVDLTSADTIESHDDTQHYDESQHCDESQLSYDDI